LIHSVRIGNNESREQREAGALGARAPVIATAALARLAWALDSQACSNLSSRSANLSIVSQALALDPVSDRLTIDFRLA